VDKSQKSRSKRELGKEPTKPTDFTCTYSVINERQLDVRFIFNHQEEVAVLRTAESQPFLAPASMYHAVPFALMNTKAMNRAPRVPCPSRGRKPINPVREITRLFLLLAGLLLLQHLLDDLLLLNEESSDNTVTDTATASRATVGTLDGLLGLADLGVLAGSESGDLEGQC
jgi:hypothetical protein